ncbi:hypothetical protein [Halosegnis sp.]|uniref:hypothetical protein n=1 Tax=Halosegnis sp. TaxID=2864959 RepID=UPI0035D3EB94
MDADAARRHLLGKRHEWVCRALDCAASVAAGWDGPATTDRERVVPPYRATLRRAGVLEAAPTVLGECVAAAGERLAADPVAAPPYVVVTGEGLLLRATLDKRLLVWVRAFRLRRTAGGGSRRYERVATDPEGAVAVETI